MPSLDPDLCRRAALRGLIGCGLAWLAGPVAAEASFATVNWKEGTAGSWNDPRNWDASSPPRTGQSAVIFGAGSAVQLSASTNQLRSIVLEDEASLSVQAGTLTTRAGGLAIVRDASWSQTGGTVTLGGDLHLQSPTIPARFSVGRSGALRIDGTLILDGSASTFRIEGKRQRTGARQLEVRKGNPTLHFLIDDPRDFPPLTLERGLTIPRDAKLRLSLGIEDFAPRQGQFWVLVRSAEPLAFRFCDAAGNSLESGSVLTLASEPFSLLYSRNSVVLQAIGDGRGAITRNPATWPDGLTRPTPSVP